MSSRSHGKSRHNGRHDEDMLPAAHAVADGGPPAEARDVGGDKGTGNRPAPGSGDAKEPSPVRSRRRPGVLYRASRFTLKLLLPILVLAAGYAVNRYLVATAPDIPKRAKMERTYNVKSVVARPGDYRPELTLYGTTMAGRQVDIRALVGGQVLETGQALVEGGEIAKGDMIVAIDPFDYRRSKDEVEAQLAEARAKLVEQKASLAADQTSLKFAKQQLSLSNTDLDRAVPLARRGTVSDRTVDDRRNVVIQRQQSVEQLQNNIQVWNARILQQGAIIDRLQNALVRAERRLAETRLDAPFNAYVTEVGAQVGRIVSANDKVATLIDSDWIEVRFTLTDSQFGRIMAQDKTIKGRKIKVLWKVGNEPLSYTATVDRVAARVASNSGGVDVLARLDNARRPVQMRPGTFVEVRIPDVEFTSVYRLPNTALYQGNRVYAIVDDRLSAREVRQVGIAGDDILVSGAIKPGERLLTTRLSTPGDGVKVQESK